MFRKYNVSGYYTNRYNLSLKIILKSKRIPFIFHQNDNSKPINYILVSIFMSQSIQQLASLITQIDPSYDQSSITDLKIGVYSLDDIVEQSTKATVRQIDRIIDIAELSLDQHPAVPLLHCSHLIDFVVTLIVRYPKLATKKKNRANRLIVAICKAFIKIPSDISQEWMNPPNGYSEDNQQPLNNEEQQAQKQLISTFETLSQIIKSKQTIQHFEPCFKELIQNTTDWRYQYAAITLASQIGGEIQKINQYDLYIQTAINLLQSPNPKIRYACFHVIGQYSDEMKPEFQEKYYDLIVPQMIKLFQDPVPRVVAHSYSCFSNFFQNINEVWKIQQFFTQILPISTYYLKNASTWVKQSVISSLSSLATTKDAFGPYLTQILEIINQFISQYTGVPEYKHSIEMSFQFISLVLICQNKQYVGQYVNSFKTLLFTNKNYIGQQYFIGAWNRLCSSYQAFTDLTQVMGSLLEVITNIISYNADTIGQQALKSLCMTCDSFKSEMIPYASQLVQVSKSIINDENKSINLRQKAIQLLFKIAQSTKSTDASASPEWKDNILKEIIVFLNSLNNNPQLACQLYINLANLLKLSVPELTADETVFYFQSLKISQEKLMSFLNATIECMTEQENKGDEQIDSDQVDLQVSLENLRNAAQGLPQCFQALLKTQYPQVKSQLITYMIQTSSFYVQKTNQFKFYGLNLSLPLLLQCSFEQLSQVWWDIMNLYFSFSQDPFSQLRNTVVYGLGEMFLKMPLDNITQNNLISWLQRLWQAYATPYTTEKGERLIAHSKDNVISAIGKLIFKCAPKFPAILHKKIYQCWLNELPLNQDMVEGNIQQGYLIDILDKNPSLLVESCDDLKKICIIYAKFIKVRYNQSYKQIDAKTKSSLKKIMSWPIFKESQIYLWNNLTNSQRNILTRAISN